MTTNHDNVIDSRDVIERLAELESWDDCTVCSEKVILGPKTWIHAHSEDMYCGTGDGAMASPTILDEDESDELLSLRKLNAEGEQSSDDWSYGATLIRDSYFTEYAQELAEEIGDPSFSTRSWPFTCIDWERAARELQMDYTPVEFDGVTYWVR